MAFLVYQVYTDLRVLRVWGSRVTLVPLGLKVILGLLVCLESMGKRDYKDSMDHPVFKVRDNIIIWCFFKTFIRIKHIFRTQGNPWSNRKFWTYRTSWSVGIQGRQRIKRSTSNTRYVQEYYL